MKTVKVYISGAVQGVFFRRFLEKNALALNLKGFCRNLEDKRVEIIVEGPDAKVNEMITVCRKGPRHSTVSKVEVVDMNHQGFNNFKVLSM